jgi:lysophospholipase L1-like esterase
MTSNDILTPIAMLQGLWLLQRTPRLAPPPGCAGRFGIGLGAPLRVVGVGDSAIAGIGVSDLCCSITATYARLLQQRMQRDVEWRVHGHNGATSDVVLQSLAPSVPVANTYLISVGVNDATRGVKPRRYAANLMRIVALLRRRSPQCAILFGGVPPLECFPALPWPLRSVLATRARHIQRAAVAVAARHERVFCFVFPPTMPASQFADDGFHPAEYACERWAMGLLDLWPPATTTAITTDAEAPWTRPDDRQAPVRVAGRRAASRRADRGPDHAATRASRV